MRGEIAGPIMLWFWAGAWSWVSSMEAARVAATSAGLHAAGVCDLDICEERPRYAHDINVVGAKNIVDIFGPSCPIMYVSADLVFSGHTPPPNGYDESDEPDPLSVVGKTFVLAEQEIMRAADCASSASGFPWEIRSRAKKGPSISLKAGSGETSQCHCFTTNGAAALTATKCADIVVELFSLECPGSVSLRRSIVPSACLISENGFLKRESTTRSALKTWSRHDDINGPPRIGNVHLDSRKTESIIGRKIKGWIL